MVNYFVICLIFVQVIYKVNAQAPTVPTAGPTDPTTTTTTVFTIPTPSTITQSTTIPSAPTLTTSSLNSVTTTTTTTTGSSLICPPDGINHLPTWNCQTFIVCVYGRPHEGSCSDGTLFDLLTSSCLPAANVDCGTRYRP